MSKKTTKHNITLTLEQWCILREGLDCAARVDDPEARVHCMDTLLDTVEKGLGYCSAVLTTSVNPLADIAAGEYGGSL